MLTHTKPASKESNHLSQVRQTEAIACCLEGERIQLQKPLQAARFFVKAGEIKEAVLVSLKSSEEAPDYKTARRYLKKVKDNHWIENQAKRHLSKKHYAQALIFYDHLSKPIELGYCLLLLNKAEQCLNAWNEVQEKDRVNQIMELCLKANRLDVGAAYIIRKDPAFPDWHNGNITEEKTPALFKLMWQYVQENPHTYESIQWANRLIIRDKRGQLVYQAFRLHEYLHDYSKCLKIITRWQQVNHVWEIFQERIRQDNVNGYPSTKEGTAIHYYIMEDLMRYRNQLNKLELSRNNACLFLLPEFTPEDSLRFLDLTAHTHEAIGHELFFGKLAETARAQEENTLAGIFFHYAGKSKRALALRQKSDLFDNAKNLDTS